MAPGEPMKAMVLHGPGEPLRLERRPRPTCGPNDVLVRVRACGVGLTVVNLLQTPGRVTQWPRIPGHEIAGDVVAVGSEVRTIAPGTAVTNHFYLTCGQCRNCRSGRETLCLAPRGNVGAACDGGYAEYVALPERNLVPIPPGVSYAAAAIASDAIATPYHACHREARLGPGDTVLVIGAGGGVGIHMVQMARLCGARVFAVDLGEEKLALARAHGADGVIDAGRGDIVEHARALTDGQGVDAVIDIVASRQTLAASIRALAIGGRLVIVGARPPEVYGDSPAFLLDPLVILHRGLEIHSSRYVTTAEIAQTLELVRHGRIEPVITRTFALEDVADAHEAIRANRALGRLAIEIE